MTLEKRAEAVAEFAFENGYDGVVQGCVCDGCKANAKEFTNLLTEALKAVQDEQKERDLESCASVRRSIAPGAEGDTISYNCAITECQDAIRSQGEV